MADFFTYVGFGSGYVLVWVLCLLGIILSGLSFSGTWLVWGGTILASFLSGVAFPGWKTVVFFLLLCLLVEVGDFLAGAWGVKKRGGSGMAGLGALVGSFVGLFLGSFIPVPILGTLFGMFAGCFAGAFGVEYFRLNEKKKAAHIAGGAVVARVLMLCLKLGVTLGMVVLLLIGVVIK